MAAPELEKIANGPKVVPEEPRVRRIYAQNSFRVPGVDQEGEEEVEEGRGVISAFWRPKLWWCQEKKREKKAQKEARKAEKELVRITEAQKLAESAAKHANEEEMEAARHIDEIQAELDEAEAAAAAAEESSSEDPETVARTLRLRAQLNEAYEQSAQAVLAAAERAEAAVAKVTKKRKRPWCTRRR